MSDPRSAVGVRRSSDHLVVLELWTAAGDDLMFALHPFPGWSVSLDGRSVEVETDPDHERLRVRVPSGRHTFKVEFRNTRLRRAANLISLISATLVLVIASVPKAAD